MSGVTNVEGKVEVVDIMNSEVQTRLEEMKGRAPGTN